jgi:hypothetical protein
MPKNGKVQLEISDILDEKQEDAVIRALEGQVPESGEELRQLFVSTDTYLVRDLTPQKAESLAADLGSLDLSIRILDPDSPLQEPEEEEPEKVTCPNCGFELDGYDWRCPECYYEFPGYLYTDDYGS